MKKYQGSWYSDLSGGVYVRVAGTTRFADEYMIKELLFEGSNRYYDQALCTGLNVTDASYFIAYPPSYGMYQIG